MSNELENRIAILQRKHKEITDALQQTALEIQRQSERQNNLVAARLKIEGALEALLDLQKHEATGAEDEPKQAQAASNF